MAKVYKNNPPQTAKQLRDASLQEGKVVKKMLTSGLTSDSEEMD